MSKIETFGSLGRRDTKCHRRPARNVAKRAMDVSVAVTLLVLLLPLLLLLACAIRLESRGPVLFRQRRTGLNGKAFNILKLRTMRVVENGPHLKQATRKDSRVTRLGAVLRALSIDELPQLINVLRGDMSLVGPRPHALDHDKVWSGKVPRYRARFAARPGLTGYAQVLGLRGEVRDDVEIRARVAADIEYIENWSFALDLKIMIRTVPLLFHDPRAY